MDEHNMKYLLESSQKNRFNIEIIGIGTTFSWLQRIISFRTYLEQSNIDIICFTDGYDVFYLDDLTTIKNKFLQFNCDILWSVEKSYTHQLDSDKSFFDNLYPINFGYKYLNAGTYIGYREQLLRFFGDILDISLKDNAFINELSSIKYYNDDIRGSDQTWISHHLCKNWNKYNIQFDIYCDVFYIPTEDWSNLELHIQKNMTIIATGKTPSIIHVCYKSLFNYILDKLYVWKYGTNIMFNFLVNKKYNWGTGIIQFLENGEMDAFGNGIYYYLDKHKIIAFFGEKEHEITFNENYSEYTSIRKHDNECIRGNIVLFDFLVNKKYMWGTGIIHFLENGVMDAFGNGIYSYLDKHKINACFGGREHEITFNENYSEYTSIRKHDNECIKGNII
jgi:uncharacterized Fe-S cluster protein YjdI